MFKTILRTALAEHPGYSPRAIHRKVRFFFRALLNRRSLERFANRMDGLELRHAGTLDTRVVGLVDHPYMHKAWDIERRLDVVATHREILGKAGSVLTTVTPDNPLDLACLDHACAGLRVVIDRAPWFKNEGELVLNLFLADLRVASLAFAVDRDESNSNLLLVGALQGIHRGIPHEQSLSIYKDLTKNLDGLRPKPLLVDILRMLAPHLDAKRILAIADENRQHRHAYFGQRDQETFASNYDEIWEGLGGQFDPQSGFFDIPLAFASRNLTDIPSKKRAMYRRRYETLAFISNNVENALNRQ
jgi:uncharacterized protein VirK/YbjX